MIDSVTTRKVIITTKKDINQKQTLGYDLSLEKSSRIFQEKSYQSYQLDQCRTLIG